MGKTVLARTLLWGRRYVIVHDGKGMLDWADRWPHLYRLTTDFKELLKLRPEQFPRVIYRPHPNELLDAAKVDAFFRWVYRRGNCTLYVDETYSVVQTGITPPAFFACVTRGREMGLEVWCGMQRPTLVPLVTLTEAQNFYIFYLQWHDDRRRMAWSSGITEEQQEELPPYHFYYARTWSRQVFGPLELELEHERRDARNEKVTASAAT